MKSPHWGPSNVASNGVLHAQGCARAEKETEEKKAVRDQIGDQVKQRIQ